jgi:DNA-binding LacI/PurR family transcriptional regulator
LSLAEPPTALFAGNDETAAGAIAVLRARGIPTGAGFPIVSFDDVVFARLMAPALTTVHQPMRELGERAAGSLLTIINGKKPDPVQMVLPTHLVVRSSCGC